MSARAIPYTCWIVDLVAQICGVYPWSHDQVMKLRPAAAFLYAMRADAERWQRIEDQRMASSFANLDERGKSWLMEQINFKLSGPGLVPKFEDLLTPTELEEARKAQDEHDELYRKLESQGLLFNSDGTAPIGLMLEGG
jgi:hypothetical protein